MTVTIERRPGAHVILDIECPLHGVPWTIDARGSNHRVDDGQRLRPSECYAYLMGWDDERMRKWKRLNMGAHRRPTVEAARDLLQKLHKAWLRHENDTP